MTILLEKAMDSAKVRAGNQRVSRSLAPLTLTARERSEAMPEAGSIPVAGPESSPAHKMGHHHQQSKPKAPSPFASARALEAAAARRREERTLSSTLAMEG